ISNKLFYFYLIFICQFSIIVQSSICVSYFFFFFFFNDTATTEIYTLSLHDALPIYAVGGRMDRLHDRPGHVRQDLLAFVAAGNRSEEHTSELQSRRDLVCRLLLEKKKKNKYINKSKRKRRKLLSNSIS